MKTKLISLIVVLILLGAALSACNRPASEDPALKATPTIPFPVNPTLGVSQFATQTAAARQPAVVTATQPGGQATTPAASTSQPGAPTAAATTIVNPQPTTKPTDKPIVVIPTITRPESYTIQTGEFLFCIARRFNLDVASFVALNGLSTSSQPAVGTTLKIPQTGTWAGARMLANHPDTYTVKSGDSIGKIACLYGDVTPEAILAANGLKSADEITPGKVLQIP